MTRRGLVLRSVLILAAAANAALALAAWTRQPWANGPAEWRWLQSLLDRFPLLQGSFGQQLSPEPQTPAARSGKGNTRTGTVTVGNRS